MIGFFVNLRIKLNSMKRLFFLMIFATVFFLLFEIEDLQEGYLFSERVKISLELTLKNPTIIIKSLHVQTIHNS